MADGLSTLSSETLTAAVTSLLKVPLPESQFVESKAANNKDLTHYGKQGLTDQNGKESQYFRIQPLALPIYQSFSQNSQNNEQHVNSGLTVSSGTSQEQLTGNLKCLKSSLGQQTGSQQLLQTNQGQGIVIQQSLQTSQGQQIPNQQFIQTSQSNINQQSLQTSQGQQTENLQLLQTSQGNVIRQPLQTSQKQEIAIQLSSRTSQCHQPVNNEMLQTSHGQHTLLQQSLHSNQDKEQERSLSNKLILAADNIHLAISSSVATKGQEVIPHISSFGNFTTIQDQSINTLGKQPINNLQLQNLMSLADHRSKALPLTPSLQSSANQPNGLALPQGLQGMSLLQQLMNIQNQNLNLNASSLPVLLPHSSPVQVPPKDVSVDTPFSMMSPTQPLQNLIQNLFSQADPSGISQTNQPVEETYTATPVSYSSFDNAQELHISASKQRVASMPSTIKEQDNLYAAYINLLLEAISKNKTLPPQQFHQIQKSIMEHMETEGPISSDSVHDLGQGHVFEGQGQNQVLQVQGQNQVLHFQGEDANLQPQGPSLESQGLGHSELIEGSESLSRKPLPGLQSSQLIPLVLQKTVAGGPLQLVPLTRLRSENGQQTSQAVASPVHRDNTKGPVHIQPKPASLGVQGVLQADQINIPSPVDINTMFNLINSGQLVKETRVMQETQDGNQSSQGLTSQQLYSEGTNHFTEEMQETSSQEVEHEYEDSALDEVDRDPVVNSITSEAHSGTPSQAMVENCIDGRDIQASDPAMKDSTLAGEMCDQNDGEANYVFCIDCRKLCKDQCEYHNNVEYKSIPDMPILSMARASLPSSFYLQQSSISDLKDHMGVWCRESIFERTRLGPVVGVRQNMKTDEYKQQVRGFNPYQLNVQDDQTEVLDVDNENTSNWTRFVRMAHSLLEQNCILYRQLDHFYFITIMEIKEQEELLFWFSQELCQHLGLSEDPGVVKMQQCEHCGKQFTTKKLLNNHSKVYHPEQCKYTCSFEMCGKQCSSQSRLNSHMLTHMGMKPFECSRCGKRFSDPSNVKAHMNIHTGVKKFKCEICSKSFRQKAHRDVHVITHTKDKKYKCTFCDKTYARPGDLKTHTYRHTNELQYPCTYCEKVFYKTQGLKKHLKVHTGERNYMCGKCFKAFQTKYHRDRHLKICKEQNGKETAYMSFEEVAKLDSTCDAVPLKKVKPDDHVTDQSEVQNQSGEKISDMYYT